MLPVFIGPLLHKYNRFEKTYLGSYVWLFPGPEMTHVLYVCLGYLGVSLYVHICMCMYLFLYLGLTCADWIFSIHCTMYMNIFTMWATRSYRVDYTVFLVLIRWIYACTVSVLGIPWNRLISQTNYLMYTGIQSTYMAKVWIIAMNVTCNKFFFESLYFFSHYNNFF